MGFQHFWLATNFNIHIFIRIKSIPIIYRKDYNIVCQTPNTVETKMDQVQKTGYFFFKLLINVITQFMHYFHPLCIVNRLAFNCKTTIKYKIKL